MSAQPTRHRPARRRATRIMGLGTGMALLFAAPVAAHVDADITASEGGVDTVVFSFQHGCDGAATTELQTLFPEGTTNVTAQDPDGWSSVVAEISDGVTVTWSGGSIPDGTDSEFTVMVTFAEPAGTSVMLPVIQRCGSEELAWIDDSPNSAYPAPVVVLGQMSEPGGGGGDHGDPDDDATGDDGGTDDDPAGTDDGVNDTSDGEANDDEAGITAVLDETGGDLAEATTAEQASAQDGGGGNAGLIVFIVVVSIIIGGGTILYLRNRDNAPPAS